MKMYLPGRRLLEINFRALPTLATVGLTNKTSDHFFVPFMDYDNVEEKTVIEDAEFLQRNFDVGTMIVLRSSRLYDKEGGDTVGNYHLIGFTRFMFPQIKEIIETSRCDSHFKYGWKYQSRCWVLRCFDKLDYGGTPVKKRPELMLVLKSSTSRVANKGLLSFFEQMYNVKLCANFKCVDNCEEYELIEYPTR